MALRFNAAGSITLDSAITSSGSFTVCGWARIRGNRSESEGEIQTLFALGSSDWSQGIDVHTSNWPGKYFGVSSDLGWEDSALTATVDTWYFVAMSASGTGTNAAKLRVAAIGSTTFTTADCDLSSFTPAYLGVGNPYDNWADAAFCAVKAYTRSLSDAELLQEAYSIRPASTSGLVHWFPFIGNTKAALLVDLIGGGTITEWEAAGVVEDGPPVSWGASPIWIVDHPAGGAGDVTVSVPSTSLTLSANAPTVVTTANKVVDVPKGTLSLTSFVPSVAVSDHKLVNVPQGSLLLFGLAPTVAATAHVTVSVPADALSLSTFVPTVTATGNVLISVPLATLSLAATAPLVLTGASQIVQVPKGTLTLAAEAPTVATTANQVVSVPKADLTLTSYEPSVVATANQKVDVPAASLELTGYAPTVSADGGTIVSVPFSSLELTLHAPTIVTPRVVSIPEAVLELVAYEPTIITPRLIDVPSTSLTLTSFAPEVHTTAVIEVPATSLTITGYAPSVDAGSGGGVASTRVTWG